MNLATYNFLLTDSQRYSHTTCKVSIEADTANNPSISLQAYCTKGIYDDHTDFTKDLFFLEITLYAR